MPSFPPIAIVGQACLLPGAHSPDELWSHVLAGRDLLGEADAGTWQVRDPARLMRSEPDAPPAERIPSRRGGYVTGFENIFRPSDHRLERALVAAVDPLVQWLLHVGHTALLSAGLDPAARHRGGAIVGNLSYPTYGLSDFAASVWARELAGERRVPAGEPLNRFMSGLPASLLCESLQLTRGGFMVDAACASSLYAIKYACDWLADGRADVMLAGGVARVHGLTIHAGFTTLQALSPSGRSRPFHARADGLVPSEGAALVVLQRLEDAVRERRPILGVIRGVGLANDGRGSGLLVPSAAGQVRAMRAAYAGCDLRPADIDLLECHATGTLVGDTAEIQSGAEVFAGHPGLALGSLKAHLGHLLPVAGVAGLLKVLQAMQHGVHPALPALEEPNPALAGTPLAPPRETRPWVARGLRRAAVNAFGFGGNNAHLLVEQAPAGRGTTVSIPAPRPPAGRAAIVAVALRTGDAEDTAACWRTALGQAKPVAPALRPLRLPLAGLAYPPQDLAHALPQQVVMLELAHEVLARTQPLPPERTGVFVGMGCDAEACRFGLNLRLGEFLAELGTTSPDAAALAAARESLQPGPVAATTLGLMPNIVANRLNRQHGCGGASCAVSAEQLSGLHGLELAVRALAAGELDAALVGAVDLGAEPVHTAALAAVLGELPGVVADGACLLVLKREADARRDGDAVLALVDSDRERTFAGAIDWTAPAGAVHARCGYAHAADALLQVASAALALHERRLPEPGAEGFSVWPAPETGPRAVRLEVAGMRDEIAVLYLTESDRGSPVRPGASAPAPAKHLTFPVHRPPVAAGLRPLVEPAADGEPMPRPPVLRSALLEPDPCGTDDEPTDVRPPEHVVASAAAGVATDATGDAVSEVHARFLEEMSSAHVAFLSALGRVPVDEGFVSAPGAVALEPVAPDVAPAAAAPAAVVSGTPTGPTFSRAELEQLAAGRISALFGPAFAGQDGFHRQVRMPMPPMLLADRVTGIDAVPGELGRGTIWTETDVRPDAWYLHRGRAPLGITIEAGQADLLLVSWMGIDRHNRSERVYRLLGCEATVKGPLPRIGDTLRFDIHVDGHAQLGAIRMMFFHSDLSIDGDVRLSVRHGQAGFFSDEELAQSEGVLWDAATEPAPPLRPGATVPPPALTHRRRFDPAQVAAFAAGRAFACFGPGFELTATHSRTPSLQGGRLCFIDEVTAFDAAGGPWGRGYLRAVKAIQPDAWFFAGHFKNDPCMPGTLMLDGAVQAMEFFLAALGCTVRRDGWRFQTPPETTMQMRCRGQCVPTSRELVYEVYVEEFYPGVQPRLRASVMASVDGRKAFLCQGLAIELVPDWPLEEMLRSGEIAATQPGVGHDHDGFVFDHRSLLACALGRPSEGFGPAFRVADGPRLLPRLPRPPYHFMTRIASVAGTMGRPAPGLAVTSEFDLSASDWFFARSGNGTMPACVFMEALLQPCGWLASFGRDPAAQAIDLFFRNLDGTLTWQEEIAPQSGTLQVRAELTQWSDLGTTIITGFRVAAALHGREVARMETVFGFFPGDAFANQAGLPPSPLERDFIARASDWRLDLRGAGRDPFSQPGAALAAGPLLMLDRLTGWWPEAGTAGLGVARAATEVRPDEWFFRAHFMQDPVQPGSLGIEALLQLLQAAIRLAGIGAEWAGAARFEPVALGAPLTWKYRGQVVPTNGRIETLVELISVERTARDAITVQARGSLWVDGRKIYETAALAMRVRHSPGSPPAPAGGIERTYRLDVDRWLGDHRPSFTTAVLPLTAMLDVMSAAPPDGARLLTAIGAFAPTRWLACGPDQPLRLRIERPDTADDVSPVPVRLLAWREAGRAELSRFDLVGATTLTWAGAYPAAPAPRAALAAPEVASPYLTGETTHGPAFHLLRSLRRSAAGASAILDAAAGAVPVGRLHPALLDACTHAMPLSDLGLWFPGIDARWNALPRGIVHARFFAPTPASGEVRCELRPAGLAADTGHPQVHVQFIAGDAVWCELLLELALLDAAPFLGVAYEDRRAFMRRTALHPVRFSRRDGHVSVGTPATLAAFQWMPRQLETLFQLRDGLSPEERAEAITAKEHVGHAAQVHPAEVGYDPATGRATLPHLPLQAWPLSVRREDGRIEVRDAGALEFVDAPGGTLFAGEFLHDLSRALRRDYVREFRLADPAALAAIRGRPCLVCANHQTAIESMLFTEMFTRWSGLPATTVTRTEHAESWMGRLTDFLWRHPRRTVQVNPQLLFARDRPEAFFDVLGAYKAAQSETPHSLHLHVEGEQALTCRHRVKRMSAVVVDLALELDLPVVPLKYSGGLPVTPLPQIVSFPVGYGRQDYVLGRPLLPDELRARPRPRAAALVVDALNALPPAAGAEQPLGGRPGLAEEIRTLCADRHLTEVQAAVVCGLRDLPDPSAATRAVLAYPSVGDAGLPGAPEERAWLAGISRWLWGGDESIHRESEHWKRTARS